MKSQWRGMMWMTNQPTPIIKLPQAYEYAQLLRKFAVEHPLLEFSAVDVMNMQSFMIN
jgi:hypothetical protein